MYEFTNGNHERGPVDRARVAGAVIVSAIPGGVLVKRLHYAPTLVTGVTQDAEPVQRQVFGPVPAALPVGTGAAAIALANDHPPRSSEMPRRASRRPASARTFGDR